VERAEVATVVMAAAAELVISVHQCKSEVIR